MKVGLLTQTQRSRTDLLKWRLNCFPQPRHKSQNIQRAQSCPVVGPNSLCVAGILQDKQTFCEKTTSI